MSNPLYSECKLATPAPNRLERQLNVRELNRVWVANITDIRTHEGWLYLSVTLDLSPDGSLVIDEASHEQRSSH